MWILNCVFICVCCAIDESHIVLLLRQQKIRIDHVYFLNRCCRSYAQVSLVGIILEKREKKYANYCIIKI